VVVGDIRRALDIDDGHERVGRRLQPQEFRLLAERVLDGVEVGHVDVGELDVVLRVHLVEDASSAAVDVLAADDVVAGVEEVEYGVDRSHPRGETAAVLAVLQASEVRF